VSDIFCLGTTGAGVDVVSNKSSHLWPEEPSLDELHGFSDSRVTSGLVIVEVTDHI
jgi:hypothetical protein